jgi:glycyl-tRNA synthetase beta chain
MMDYKSSLLIEIGLEELPHSFIRSTVDGFENLFLENLSTLKIGYGEVKRFSTPRRIALFIRDVAKKQDDFIIEKRGPSIERAYLPDGQPSKALAGFLKGNNITIEETIEKESNQTKYLFLVKEIEGRQTAQLLPEALQKTLSLMGFPKTMKWESTGYSFAKPMRSILFMFGKDVVPFSIAGIQSSNLTFGHRAYGDQEIIITDTGEYEKKLEECCVVPDRNKRKERLMSQIEEILKPKNLAVPEVARELYDINADLTEFPHAVLCEFEKEFLDLPPEVLTSEMIEHQYYLPLTGEKSGDLSNSFIAVSNIEDNTESRYGYQRVLRARLDDGAFFYNEDRKTLFPEYSNRLKTVTFHEKIGSLLEKVDRIKKISGIFSSLLSVKGETADNIIKAAGLCKNDLPTLMVNEFPNLQGVMGYYYSLASGFEESVALAVKEHYLPRFAGDRLPSGVEGAIVGIADRLDTIIGMFSVGIRPKGSKDPFALRRNVFAIVRIIIGQKLNFSMRELIENAADLYKYLNPDDRAVEEIEVFIKTRIKSIFEDLGFKYDEIDASLTNVMDDIYEAYRRVQALHNFRDNRDFEDLLISFKRMGNIIKDEKEFSFSKLQLIENEEKELYNYFINTKEEIVRNISARNYHEVYSVLSTFKPYVDSFFDNVLVMEEDPKLKINRLGLLKNIISVFSDIIDISKIVSA